MKKFGLVGFPLGHSFSSKFFNEKFQNEHIDAQYENFELPSIEQLPALLAANPQLCGLNVTIPYKEKIIPFLNDMSNEAKAIGAVNVVKVLQQGNRPRLIGYNSDVIGFSGSIEPLLAAHHRRALVLGTGGASKAVLYALHKLGVETQLVSRVGRSGIISYADITPHMLANDFKLVVNCTPVGMYPHTDECPPLPYEAMNEQTLLYDLVYNPSETLFMKRGAEHGAVVKNGLEMLLLQAYASWDFWNKE